MKKFTSQGCRSNFYSYICVCKLLFIKIGGRYDVKLNIKQCLNKRVKRRDAVKLDATKGLKIRLLQVMFGVKPLTNSMPKKKALNTNDE